MVILGRIVAASGQIFRSDLRPQDEIFRSGMPFRLLEEQAPLLSTFMTAEVCFGIYLDHCVVYLQFAFLGENFTVEGFVKTELRCA